MAAACARRSARVAATDYPFDHYEVAGTTVRKYYALGGQRVAMRTAGALSYLLTDHLGSTAVTTGAAGAKTGELRYLPFGVTRTTWGVIPTDRRFTGQPRYATLGLDYFGARWYDPALGRFISADTIVPEPGNPQALNRYSYALNNALKYTDPNGHAADAGGVGGDLEAWMRLLDRNRSPKFNGWLHERDCALAALLYARQEGMPAEVVSGLAAVLESKQTTLLVNGYGGSQAAQRAAVDAYAADVGQGVIGFATGVSSLGGAAQLSRGKGANPYAEGPITSVKLSEKTTLYRVWGGKSSRAGGWLSVFRPAAQAEARSLLALPPDNSAEFVSEVCVPAGTRVQFSRAAPAFDQLGGALQVQLLERIPETAFSPGESLPAGLLMMLR